VGYEHFNSKGKKYFLHKFGNGLYFFKQEKMSNACDLPEGFEVIENPRNGLPMVRKRKE